MGAQYGSRASETRNKVNLNVIGKTLAERKKQRGRRGKEQVRQSKKVEVRKKKRIKRKKEGKKEKKKERKKERKIQLSPAITEGPTNFIYYWWIFVIAKIGKKRKGLEGTRVLHSILTDFRYFCVR